MYEVSLNLDSVEKLMKDIGISDSGPVQKAIDKKLLEIFEPYTPYKTGKMMRSAAASTVLGSGEISYTATSPKGYPYPPKVYQHTGNFTRTHHPLATGYWAETAFDLHCQDVIDEAIKALML